MNAAYDDDLKGTNVARYAIVDLIGTGGMGCVYRAHDARLERPVAIKVRRRQDPSPAEHNPQLVAEARALSRLSHPRIATIYDLVTQADRDFIIMEFVPGPTLKEVLAGGPLAFADVLRLGRQLMQGLAAAHAARLIHCDIKPANLKVTTNGELKILDFGLAQHVPARNPLDGTPEVSTRSVSQLAPIGTMPYMAPEQLRGEATDERSDIFSAGAVLYEMATGQQAFPQGQMALLVDAILNHHPVAASSLNPRIPRAFDLVVDKAIEKWPVRRYQTVNEVEIALAGLQMPTRRRKRSSSFSHWLSGLLG